MTAIGMLITHRYNEVFKLIGQLHGNSHNIQCFDTTCPEINHLTIFIVQLSCIKYLGPLRNSYTAEFPYMGGRKKIPLSDYGNGTWE